MLLAIPVIGIGGALALIRLLGSRPGAGIVLLLAAGLWIAVFASDVSDGTPRRDKLRGGGIDFGR